MADEHSRRMDQLESHIAHLEHQVEQLNGVIIEQGKLLERLKKEVQRQSSAMQTMELSASRATFRNRRIISEVYRAAGRSFSVPTNASA